MSQRMSQAFTGWALEAVLAAAQRPPGNEDSLADGSSLGGLRGPPAELTPCERNRRGRGVKFRSRRSFVTSADEKRRAGHIRPAPEKARDRENLAEKRSVHQGWRRSHHRRARDAPVAFENRVKDLIDILAVAEERLAENAFLDGANLQQRAVAAAVRNRRARFQPVNTDRLERE